MKLSVNSNSSNKSKADEVRCASTQLGSIFPFLKENPHIRCVIEYVPSQPYEQACRQIDAVRSICDYTICCPTTSSLKYFLAQQYHSYLSLPVTDWETFTALAEMGVSDFLIDGPLGFQLNSLQTAKDKYGLTLRCNPTSTSIAPLSAVSANHFFIRPEDLPLYSSTIDIFEMRAATLEEEDVLFSVYQRGSFFYNIDNLIKHLPSGVNNSALAGFADDRLNCGQRCMCPDGHCHKCNSTFHYLRELAKYGRFRSIDK